MISGTWAYDTMSSRISRDIFPRLIEDNKDELSRPTSPLRSACLAELMDLKGKPIKSATFDRKQSY